MKELKGIHHVMDHDHSDHLFEVGEGGNGAQAIVEYNTSLPFAR